MTDPQQWNRYAYARGNPLRFTDPTGLFACSGGPTSIECVDHTGVSARLGYVPGFQSGSGGSDNPYRMTGGGPAAPGYCEGLNGNGDFYLWVWCGLPDEVSVNQTQTPPPIGLPPIVVPPIPPPCVTDCTPGPAPNPSPTPQPGYGVHTAACMADAGVNALIGLAFPWAGAAMAVTGTRVNLVGWSMGTSDFAHVGLEFFNKAQAGAEYYAGRVQDAAPSPRIQNKAAKGVRYAARQVEAHNSALRTAKRLARGTFGLSLLVDVGGCL